MKSRILKLRQNFIKKILNKHDWSKYYNTNVKYNIANGDKVITGKADFLLTNPYKVGKYIAVFELEPYNLGTKFGIDLGNNYSRNLKVHYIFSTNCKNVQIYNIFTRKCKTIKLSNFPTPKELCDSKLTIEKYKRLINLPYYINNKKPRYYQKQAVNKFCLNLVHGKKHMMLVMATGSGKTYTAFQIVYKMFEATKNHLLQYPIHKVLYVTDRTNLLKQPMDKDFRYFVKRHIASILSGKQLLNYKYDDNYQIVFASYQLLFGKHKYHLYRHLPHKMFDLIICDEAHRGADKIDNNWHKILNHFAPTYSPVVVMGMTATPRETDEANLGYYGYPIYHYSLNKGIKDKYLSSYYLLEYGFHPNFDGYNPYNTDNPKINNKVIRKVLWLEEAFNNKAKIAIFCQTIHHAHKIEQLILNNGYQSIDCLTGDGKYRYGSNAIKKFCKYNHSPFIATTSNLLKTGIDIPSLRCIILDCHINSKIDLQQIIGRGTRQYKHKNKFILVDFGDNQKLLEHLSYLSNNTENHIIYSPTKTRIFYLINRIKHDEKQVQKLKINYPKNSKTNYKINRFSLLHNIKEWFMKYIHSN